MEADNPEALGIKFIGFVNKKAQARARRKEILRKAGRKFQGKRLGIGDWGSGMGLILIKILKMRGLRNDWSGGAGVKVAGIPGVIEG